MTWKLRDTLDRLSDLAYQHYIIPSLLLSGVSNWLGVVIVQGAIRDTINNFIIANIDARKLFNGIIPTIYMQTIAPPNCYNILARER